MAQQAPSVFLVAGPTASGKSGLALAMAERLDGEIVNADALQLYADLRLLTARPNPDEERRAPHHLYGVADGADGWSVGRWLKTVLPVLDDIRRRGRPAVVVGGTGLYFRALTEGLAEIPEVLAETRQAAAALLDDLGEAGFRARLAEVDPEAASRIAQGDRQRLARAMEVYAASGRPLSAWHAQTRAALSPDAWRAAVLEPPRPLLYARCDARLRAMVEGGALEEVRRLADRKLDPAAPVMKAVGVRELAEHLSGAATLEAALAQAQQQTRRYAKRQATWLRNQAPSWPRLQGEADIQAFLEHL